MNLTTILILVAIGISAGILGGFIGIGGGILIIPALVLFLGLSQKEAQGTSLAIMLPPIGLLAAMNYYKAGYINLKYAIIIATAFLIGGYFGSKLAVSINDQVVKKIFAIVLLIVSLRMLFEKHP
ncbi:MAG TPA: sulfite exporter TauE/SafE family protein [Bacteroidales bacterium]|nr:sulfite exporter TauE/SafE family protein [Bacteroidales bacterium]